VTANQLRINRRAERAIGTLRQTSLRDWTVRDGPVPEEP